MNQFSALKNTLIAFFLLLSALYALPNVFGSDLAVQISAAGDAAIAQSDLDKVKATLESNKVRYKSVELVGRRVLARFEDNKSQLGAKEVLKQEMGRNYVAALNLAPSIPAWLSDLGGKAMSLGLDLRGGVHFLLEVDMQAVANMSLDKSYNELRTLLRQDRLYKSINKEKESLLVHFKTLAAKEAGLSLIKSELGDLVILDVTHENELYVSVVLKKALWPKPKVMRLSKILPR